MTGRDGGRLELARRVEQVSRAMASHGGGVELVEVERDGTVRLRFTGLCAGCRMRPLTFAETIEPALTSLPDIDHVVADGARVSDQALARMRHYFDKSSYSIE